MELDSLLEGILDRSVSPLSAPTEADFHALWLSEDVNSSLEFVTAVHGGALADRLAWVFLSGYQATIRRCFPELPAEPGWAAFVNTEDRTAALPGTQLQGDAESRWLTGWKTWVAGAAHVDRLLVSAAQNEVPFLIVRRDAPGVRIDVGEPKGYLSELAQARVSFERTPISEAQIIGDLRTFPLFRAAEGAYVRASLGAFMLTHALRLGASPKLIAGALSVVLSWRGVLELQLPSKQAAVAALGAADFTSSVAAEFEGLLAERDDPLLRLWNKDRRMVGGASTSIADRAAAALGVGGLRA